MKLLDELKAEGFNFPFLKPTLAIMHNGNVLVYDNAHDLISYHRGRSDTVLFCIDAPTPNVAKMWVENDNLVTLDKKEGLIYKHDGFTSTITSTSLFKSDNTDPITVAWWVFISGGWITAAVIILIRMSEGR